MSGALAGIRVLELSRLLPGALCTQMLGDLGADVIKVEQPGIGDYQREFPPMRNGESGSFMLCNRNKRSITLNLKAPEAKEAVHRLVAEADVVMEGFRPGVIDRLGFGYAAMSAVNPRLVYCSLSGFGQTGPYRLVPGHDMNYLGIVGAMQLSSRPETGPLVPGMLIADIGGGTLMSAFGILAALMARQQSGRGQFVDVSMTDGAMAWMASHAAEFLFAGREPMGGVERNIAGAPCYNVYRCQDGKYLTLGIIEQHFWDRFCDVAEAPELRGDVFAQGEQRQRVTELLVALFLTRTRDDWVQLLWRHDIPAGPVNSFAEAFADPQMQAREMLQTMQHPSGPIPQLGFPVKFSGTPGEMRLPPPLLGEHTDEILAEIGYGDAARSQLRAGGAI